MPLLPILLVAHITCALGLLVPSILLPFALRARAADREPGRITRGLIRLQRDLSLVLGLRSDATDAERDKWRLRARRQRYVSYVMALAVGLIAFLMTTKPQF